MKSKILLCRSGPILTGDDLGQITVATSAVACLHEATEKKYNLIVIVFDSDFLKEREAMVELCTALKRNRHTMHVPLFCVLPCKHWGLLKRLQDAGVEYVMILDPKDRILQTQLETFVSGLSEEYQVERILSEVCPHINYFPINHNKEIMYCGAYRNRLVLGPYRLGQYCENNNHINCEYFQNPR